MSQLVQLQLVQQLGPAGRLAHDVATHPEVAQSMNSQNAEALLRQQQQQVVKVADSNGMVNIHNNAHHHGGRNAQTKSGERHDDEKEEELPQPELPHVGLLLNCKI